MNELTELRHSLKKYALDAYLIPMRDEWGCEYVPPHLQRLKYITGFTGSAGFAVITATKAAFFTDGRYTLQASLQLDKNEFEIFDSSEKNEVEWLSENLKKNSKVGYDPKIFSITSSKKLHEKLSASGIKLVESEKNLIDEIWQKRPKPLDTKPFILEKKFSGKKASEKIKTITKECKADYLLLTSSESICWLLNIRANDLAHTPVMFAYALLSNHGEVYLYGNIKALEKIENKIDADIFIRETAGIFSDLKQISNKTVELDPAITPVKFKTAIEKNKGRIIEATDPCLEARSIKNSTEIEATKTAHIRDGAALAKFFTWLEKNIGKTKLDEISIADKLQEIRFKGENFYSLSFDTIAGWKGNGAIIHYRAEEATKATIKGDGILLLDSGAQYYDGTTDVTRTITIGKPTAEEKQNFTLVLKGHIALAKQKFLKGCSGANLDVLARAALWNNGLDYKHGTGHGVGFFLNVHEGPASISRINNAPLKAGMVLSNEPGFYKKGEYGIRIENLVLVKESDKAGFYEFETLTMAPIDKNLIDKKLLNQEEIDWLNNYHDDVYNKVSPLLDADEKKWLKGATAKI